MPKREYYDLSTNEVYYVRQPNGKCYRVFSPEQMIEMVESGRITEEDHVGIQVSAEGLGGSRGTREESDTPKRANLGSQTPWSYASKTVADEARAFLASRKGGDV